VVVAIPTLPLSNIENRVVGVEFCTRRAVVAEVAPAPLIVV